MFLFFHQAEQGLFKLDFVFLCSTIMTELNDWSSRILVWRNLIKDQNIYVFSLVIIKIVSIYF